jgi:hypothetical protein
MGKAPDHKKVRVWKPKEQIVTCVKQFPDCPETPNDKDCKMCPHYKK